MTRRITDKDLNAMAALLNRLTGSPSTYCANAAGEPFEANIGHYHISHAYGGVSLHRTSNHGGGVSSVLGCGHIPKRDLYNRMDAFIAGIEQAQH